MDPTTSITSGAVAAMWLELYGNQHKQVRERPHAGELAPYYNSGLMYSLVAKERAVPYAYKGLNTT